MKTIIECSTKEDYKELKTNILLSFKDNDIKKALVLCTGNPDVKPHKEAWENEDFIFEIVSYLNYIIENEHALGLASAKHIML